MALGSAISVIPLYSMDSNGLDSDFSKALSNDFSRYPRAHARGTLAEVICFSSGIHPRADARGPLRTVDRLGGNGRTVGSGLYLKALITGSATLSLFDQS